jgi:hypothetical protein
MRRAQERGGGDEVEEHLDEAPGGLALKQRARRRVCIAAAILIAASACGPVPGGKLSGTPTPVPSDWASLLADGKEFCEIEARPEDPHSIQLECFLYEGALHAQSHRWALASWWPVESWAAIWIEHPDVRLRFGDQLFDVRAVRVEDAALREAILVQRGYRPPPEGIVVFRFEPRA